MHSRTHQKQESNALYQTGVASTYRAAVSDRSTSRPKVADVLSRIGAIHREGPILNDLVYRRLIRLLQDKTVTPVGWDTPLPCILLLGTKDALLAEGAPLHEIEEGEDQIRAIIENNAAEWKVETSVPKGFYNGQTKEWRIDPEVLLINKVVPLPTKIVNAVLCSELLKMFSEAELLSVPGFALKRIDADDYDDRTVYRVYLDIKPRSHGFIVPLFDCQKLIRGLKVFRHRNDERPFILRSRPAEGPLHG